jgi:peptidoglycan/LPS O-acetylase OafA/YrhL
VAVLSVVPLRGQTFTYFAGGPAIAALTAVLLLAWRTRTEVTHSALRALVWLGAVSYGAYLWNYPLTIWLWPHLEHGAGPVVAVLTLLAAAASWYAVERPLQRRPAREVVAQ